ncbi:TonB C-terminal domain-containing protein [bacterium]|nr:TonB C-terminal domain-containing protein [bacterium]
MKNYLRTAGKSIKLSLSSDLLLSTEYAYSDRVKVAMKISEEGKVVQSAIVNSSGSTQIDKIVLQSVISTLNVVKPPSKALKNPDFNLTITIYF